MILLLCWIATSLAAVGTAHLGLVLFRAGERGDVATRFLIGLPLFGTIVHLIGLVSLDWRVLAAVTAPLALVGIEGVRRCTPPDLPRPSTAVERVSAGLVVAALVTGATLALSPPLFRDEVAYHLAAPVTWIGAGHVVEMPLMSHSYFPFGVESAFLLILQAGGKLAGGIGVHFLHTLIMVAGLALLASWTRSWTITAAVATIPVLTLAGGSAMLEWVMTGLALVIVRSVVEGERAIVALALAAGLLTKYAFPLIALVAFIVWIRRDETDRRWWPWITGGLLGSAFYLRNLLWTGNPFEPIFSGEGGSILRYRVGDVDVWSRIAGYAFDPRYLEEALGVTPWLVLGFGGLAILRNNRHREETRASDTTFPLILMTSLLLVAALMLVGPSARILVPLVVLAMVASHPGSGSALARWLVSSAALFQLLLPLLFVVALKPWSVGLGSASVDEYLSSRRASHGVVVEMNRVLEPTDEVVVLGHYEPYWIEGVVQSGGNGDAGRVSQLLEVAGSGSARMLRDADKIICTSNLPCERLLLADRRAPIFVFRDR